MIRIFDYTNQAWTVDGVYVDCGHPAAGTVMGAGSPAPGEPFGGCDCYGRAHKGEPVSAEILAEQDEREGSVTESNNGVYKGPLPFKYWGGLPGR
jgi:hypothetical protein